MPKCTDNKPWERQQNESAKAFEAFNVYLEMGSERSIRAVAQKLNKSATLIQRWNKTHHWQERIRAYDNDIAQKTHKKAVKGYAAMAERHVNIAMQYQKKALEALNNLSVTEMEPRDIREFMKMAADMERLNRQILAGSGESQKESAASSNIADAIVNAYNKKSND